MNPEARVQRDNDCLKRDGRILNNQKKTAAEISALSRGLSILLEQQKKFEILDNLILPNTPAFDIITNLKDERMSCLELFSHGCRLAADTHHDVSMTRRNLLIGNMNNFSKGVKEAIKETEPGEFLFGTNLLETIKAAKVSETATRNNSDNRSSFKPKNFKRPLGNKARSPAPSGRHSMTAPRSYNQYRHQRGRVYRKEKHHQVSRKTS